jgi:two-component system chemotaxis response regulator CheY
VYTIGEVSKIVNITANTLRYYDEIELLKPCLVQTNNQYRYYSDAQIKELSFILEMKQYGFSLEEIKTLLKDNSNQKLKPMLEVKRVELSSEIAKLKERYILLEKRISKVAQEEDLKMKGGKVLIVDDLELARNMIKNIIEKYGYTVAAEASNGEEAIAAFDAVKPDIVIMDITMPKLDGIDAAKRIMEKDKAAKIIMCSAMSQAPIILESLKLGARDFVSKPISSLRLIKALDRAIDDSCRINTERINNIAAVLERRDAEKIFARGLAQEEVDLFVLKDINKSQLLEDINNILNEVEAYSLKEYEYHTVGPLAIEKNSIEYLKDKFAVFSNSISEHFSNIYNSKCTVEMITVENITIGEFRTLVSPSSKIGILNDNISNVPIHVHTLGGWSNRNEVLKKFLHFAAKNLHKSIPGVNAEDISVSMGFHSELKENYSTILISFSIEFGGDEKGFIMVSLPNEFLCRIKNHI